MDVYFHRQFTKQFRKLPPNTKKKFRARLGLLILGDSEVMLRLHKLTGSRRGYESMNVTGDTRAIFQRVGKTITFYEIGTHSELY